MKVYKSGHFSQTTAPPITEKRKEQLRKQLEKVRFNDRKYPLTRKAACIFRSRALNLFERAENEPSTQILTYPSHKISNPYDDLNRYCTNLRKNYGLKNYCSALEVTKKGQFHFHLIVDIPYFDTKEIKSAWNSARGFISNNSVRGIEKVKSELAVIKYCSDYLSKKGSKTHDLMKFSYSRGVKGGESVKLDGLEVEAIFKNKRYPLLHSHIGEYCWTGRFYLDSKIKSLFS